MVWQSGWAYVTSSKDVRWLTTMEAVAVADGIVGICIAGGEIIGEVPAQQKNLHFCIRSSL
jgi:hypothetical protein